MLLLPLKGDAPDVAKPEAASEILRFDSGCSLRASPVLIKTTAGECLPEITCVFLIG
jgi:hypothetical protein